MQTRRGFIGSVLGMVGSSKFRVTEVKPELVTENPVAFKLRGFADLFDQRLEDIRMFTIVDGVRILTPPVKSVTFKEDRFEIKCYDISIYRRSIYSGVGLTYKNKILAENRNLHILSVNGDTICWTYSIHLGGFLVSQINDPPPRF